MKGAAVSLPVIVTATRFTVIGVIIPCCPRWCFQSYFPLRWTL